MTTTAPEVHRPEATHRTQPTPRGGSNKSAQGNALGVEGIALGVEHEENPHHDVGN